jgi:O-antigen/teichoic acid export membrane protein
MISRTYIQSHIQHLTEALFGQSGSATLQDRLLRGAAGSLSLRVGSTALTFLLQILLARMLGIAGYGMYAYVLAWVQLLVPVAIFGTNRLLIRNMAFYQTESAWGLMHGQLRWAFRIVVFMSLGTGLLAGGAALLLVPAHEPVKLAALWIGFLLIPLMALNALNAGILQGFHHVVEGQLPELLVKPVLAVSVMVLFGLWLASFSIFWALGLLVAVELVTLLAGITLLARRLPPAVKQAPPSYQAGTWFVAALPLLLLANLHLVHGRIDLLMLEAMVSTEAVAIYAVAIKCGSLIGFTMTAVNVVLGPMFASLYAANDMHQLQHLVTRSARMLLLLTTPLVVGMVLFGESILAIFGAEFTAGWLALAILSVGYPFDVVMGSVGLLLIMTNHARDAATGLGVGMLLNLGLNLLLIPMLGIEGAALATAISIIVRNMIMAWFVYRCLGFFPNVAGFGYSKRDSGKRH